MLEPADREQLAARGIPEEEVQRQLQLFVDPPAAIQLDRPATVGDGIYALDAGERAAALGEAATALGANRVLKLVPASGAATRMFQDLLAVRSGPGLTRTDLARRAATDPAAREVLTFFDNLDRFAFHEALAAVLAARGEDLAAVTARGDVAAVLAALLDADGLGYGDVPKGLVLFHRYADGSRTAFEEHLVEGAVLASSTRATARLHFTIAAEHEPAFRRVLDRSAPELGRRHGVELAVDFSVQSPSTDTIAVDLENRPVRAADGRLLFRPGGHGALIGNLAALQGDIVFIKNIDNIPPDHMREPVADCARVLIGHLARVQRELFRHRAALADAPSPAAVDAARRFVTDVLHATLPEGEPVAALCAVLDRPLRVCGMVRNTGEPGGGPFWVREPAGGTSLQIVESAQVDGDRADQRAIFAAATHFNPVVMACGVRDWRGEPFDLHAFVDPSAVFIAQKSKDGKPLKALERPGLWNGAMARWNTIFVELPDVTFTPVKTVNDLLRPAHQPPATSPPLAAARA